MNPNASPAPILDPSVSEVMTAPAQEISEVAPPAQAVSDPRLYRGVMSQDESRSLLRSTLAELL